jgi:hypothetical protein
MAGLDQAARGAPPQEAGAPPEQEERVELAPDEELDSDIAFGLIAKILYEDEGTDQLLNIFSAQNPAPALGNLLTTMIDNIGKKLSQRGMDLSPNIWLAEGGVVDRVIDEVAELAEGAKIKFDDALQSQVFGEVIDQLKLAGQAEKNGAQMPPEEGMGPPPPGGAGGPPPMQQGGF